MTTRELIIRMVEVKNEAGRLGLYRTMHAMDEATRVVGWEVADGLTRTGRRRKNNLQTGG